jgi:hypothetical protein
VLDGGDVGHHQCERFIDSPFAAAQLGYSGFVRGIAREMKTAEAFHCDYLAFAEESLSGSDGI